MRRNNKSLCIAVLQSTSDSLFQTRNLSHKGVILITQNPHLVACKFRNVIERASSGNMRPADIPDLSDLALLPKSLKCYYEWLLCNSTKATILDTLADIQEQSNTSISRNQEIFALDDGTVHDINIKSYSDVMKTVMINENMIEAVMMSFQTKANTTDWRDGRTTSMLLGLRSTTRLPTVGVKRRRRNDTVRRLIIWNCTGLAKNAFTKVYDYLLEAHWPDILILTETRVSKFLADTILPKNSYDSMKILEPIGLLGGIIILSMSEDLSLGLRKTINSCDVEIKIDRSNRVCNLVFAIYGVYNVVCNGL